MADGKPDEGEFELVPLSPIRRMEKRLEDIEKKAGGFSGQEIYKELIDIVRLNQQLVDELAKSNDALRIELARLPSRLEDLVKKVDELVTFIRASANTSSQEVIGGPNAVGMDAKPLYDKLTELVELNKKMVETNQTLSNSLDELNKKMRRTEPTPPFIRKPLLPPRPI